MNHSQENNFQNPVFFGVLNAHSAYLEQACPAEQFKKQVCFSIAA